MHGFVLSLKREDVLRALAPGLAIGRIDVGKNMGNPLLEVLNCIAVSVEVAGTIPLPIEVIRGLKSIVAMDGDEKLNTIAVRLHHEVIQAVQHGIIPVIRTTPLKTIEGIDWSSLHSPRLACSICQSQVKTMN